MLKLKTVLAQMRQMETVRPTTTTTTSRRNTRTREEINEFARNILSNPIDSVREGVLARLTESITATERAIDAASYTPVHSEALENMRRALGANTNERRNLRNPQRVGAWCRRIQRGNNGNNPRFERIAYYAHGLNRHLTTCRPCNAIVRANRDNNRLMRIDTAPDGQSRVIFTPRER